MFLGYMVVALILWLKFMVLVMLLPMLNVLYFYISTFRSMCAVPNMALFCSSSILCFCGMLLSKIIIVIISTGLIIMCLNIKHTVVQMYGEVVTPYTYTTSAEFVVLLNKCSLPLDTFSKTWGYKVYSTQQLHAINTASITVRPIYKQRKNLAVPNA
jgi:hypothetical protein